MTLDQRGFFLRVSNNRINQNDDIALIKEMCGSRNTPYSSPCFEDGTLIEGEAENEKCSLQE